MAQNITKGISALMDEARAKVRTLPLQEALARHGDADTLFVDLRDIRELEREGRIPGAFHCPRGMLEFWIDPQSPYHKPAFAQDKHFVFFCGSGWRSLLAAQSAQAMGLQPVADIAGGFSAWKAAGGPVTPPQEQVKPQAKSSDPTMPKGKS